MSKLSHEEAIAKITETTQKIREMRLELENSYQKARITPDTAASYNPQAITQGLASTVHTAEPAYDAQYPLAYNELPAPSPFVFSTASYGYSPLCADITPQWTARERPLMDLKTMLSANMLLMNSFMLAQRYALNHNHLLDSWRRSITNLGLDPNQYTVPIHTGQAYVPAIQLPDLRMFLVCINGFHAPTRLLMCQDYVRLETQHAMNTNWNINMVEEFLSDISGDVVCVDVGDRHRNDVSFTLFDVVNYSTNFGRPMTCWELTKFYGNEHKHCVSSIHNTLAQCGIDPVQFLSTQRNLHGNLVATLTLPKELVLLCVTGWSTQALAAVVDRYMQLKATDLIEMAKYIENSLWYNQCTPVYTHHPARNAYALTAQEVDAEFSNKFGNSLVTILNK